MATLIRTIKNTGRSQDIDMDCTIFAGVSGTMLQLTQGLGTAINMDTPGFIQLNKEDVKELQKVLAKFIG